MGSPAKRGGFFFSLSFLGNGTKVSKVHPLLGPGCPGPFHLKPAEAPANKPRYFLYLPATILESYFYLQITEK